MALAAGYTRQFTRVTCYSCRIEFALSDDLYKARRNDHQSFWCPNGHEQAFTGESLEKRRIAELEAEVARQQAAVQRERSSRQWAESRTKGANIAAGRAKAALKRTIARVHAGVCPHCHRTFKQLAAHMTAKHGGKGC